MLFLYLLCAYSLGVLFGFCICAGIFVGMRYDKKLWDVPVLDEGTIIAESRSLSQISTRTFSNCESDDGSISTNGPGSLVWRMEERRK